MRPSCLSLTRGNIITISLLVGFVIIAAIWIRRAGDSPTEVQSSANNSRGPTPEIAAPEATGMTVLRESRDPKGSELDGISNAERTTSPPVSDAGTTPHVGSEDAMVAGNEAPTADLPIRPTNKLPSNSKRLGSSERAERLLELENEAAAEKDPHLAQRIMLTVAGYHVGDDDWDTAKEIYDQLKASPFPEIRATTARNLDVVERNQAILAEQDAGRREWLQLDLAGVHQRYGHEKASKTLYRALEKDATLPAVRQEAAQRLASYVSPPLILPQSIQQKEDTK